MTTTEETRWRNNLQKLKKSNHGGAFTILKELFQLAEVQKRYLQQGVRSDINDSMVLDGTDLLVIPGYAEDGDIDNLLAEVVTNENGGVPLL